jgi:hypothetical protein
MGAQQDANPWPARRATPTGQGEDRARGTLKLQPQPENNDISKTARRGWASKTGVVRMELDTEHGADPVASCCSPIVILNDNLMD